MVLGRVAIELVRIGTRTLRQYYRVEGKAFNRLYTGFPKARQIGRGVRHGLTAGSTMGSLIAPDSPGNDNAVPKQIQRRQPVSHATYKSYKTRGRQTRRTRCKYPHDR